MEFVSDESAGAKLVEAIVVELMPQAKFRVSLDNQQQMLVHAAGAAQVNFVRLRPGDKVRVEISPHDKSRGRIVQLLAK